MAFPHLILGLGHRKRVGKDTLAKILESELEGRGYEVYKLAFASELKAVAHTLFSVYGLRDGLHYECNPEQREQPLDGIEKTPRQIWIELGTALCRIEPDVTVNLLHRLIDNTMLLTSLKKTAKPVAFIITDVRFPNEVDAITEWGGLLVKVHRDTAPRSNDIADSALEKFSGWDYHIGNNGSLDDLSSAARALIDELFSKWRNFENN